MGDKRGGREHEPMCVLCAGPARYFNPFVGGAACPVVLGDSRREGAA